MVAPGDIGSSVAIYPATVLPSSLSAEQISLIEQLAEEEFFSGQADAPRGMSPLQEQLRDEAIEAEEKNQPFPLDRPHCNKHGEIVNSHRCIAVKRNGEQCGARTKHGSRCWNHMQRDLGLRIKQSGIVGAGKGLWTSDPRKTNERITKYTGDISMDSDQEHGGSKYVLQLSKSVSLDAARTDTAAGRMINDPRGSGFQKNTKFVLDNRARTVRIVATRPLKSNTELFLPYGDKYWTQFKKLKLKAGDKVAKRKAKRAAKKAVAAAAATASRLLSAYEPDPLTHQQAMAAPDAAHWREAERAEQQSLEDMNVYEFVNAVPSGAKLLDSKPVYKRKRRHDGSVARYKNRVVARGFLQRAGIDYDATFSPVVKYKTLRVMLAIAALEDLELKTMDVETAFLHAELDRPLYMKIPAGFSNVPKGAVALKLNKSLYGLHQSGLLWNAMLTQALISAGFNAGKNGDQCTFTKRTRSGQLIILAVFVDDIIYMYNKTDEREMEQIKSELMRQFKIKDLGDATSMLGMQIKRDRAARTLELDQQQYIIQCCDLLGLFSLKPTLTPENIAASSRSSARSASAPPASADDDDSNSSSSIKGVGKLTLSNYRSAVGMLGYAALATRPDAAHAYSMAARQQQNPTLADLQAVAHTFRYLLATSSLPLRFSIDSENTKLAAYSDADWAGDSSDARSTSGSVIKLGGAAVSWESTKQSNVALSSTEAEYIAASETAREIVWFRVLLAEIGKAQAAPTPLRIDNETAIRMALEDGNQGRRKHINVKHHYLRELVTDGFVTLEWVPTAEQQADILTKATSRKQFFAIRELIMGHAHSASSN